MMALTEKQAVAVTTTKATTGGLTGAIAPAIAIALVKGIETYFMIDLPIEIEALIVSTITGIASYWLVWFFPNKPKEG